MARTITGGDHLDCSIGGLVGTPAGAATLAVVFRRGSDGTWDTVISLETSANASKLSMQISDTNNLSYVSAANDRSCNISVTASDGWCLLVVTKASGTATPRGHKYVYSSNTWSHTDASSTVGGDSSDLTGGRIQLGRWGTGDPVDGDYLIAGVWKRQLGDTEIETLAFSLQAWYAAAADGGWLLDQAATAQNVIDWTGNGANQSSLTGTSISTTSAPVFSYGFEAALPSFVAGAAATTANAECATCTATAQDATTTIAPAVEHAATTVSAQDAAAAVASTAEAVTLAAAAADAATTIATSIEHAAVATASQDASAAVAVPAEGVALTIAPGDSTTSIAASADVAPWNASANDATATTGGQTTATAECATWTIAASDESASIAAGAGCATWTAAANDAASSVGGAPGRHTATVAATHMATSTVTATLTATTYP